MNEENAITESPEMLVFVGVFGDSQMSEMVERVARALARRQLMAGAVFYGGQRLDANLKPHTEETLWPYHKDMARAAIEAMREPTDGMRAAVEADSDIQNGLDDCNKHDIPDRSWAIMIDAAPTPRETSS